MAVTKLANLIDPEVMAPIISAKIESALVVAPFAKIDTTLQGTPGSTITVPVYDYIGDAADVAEGAAVGLSTLTATTKEYTIKKAAKDIQLTDEAVLSGYGNPVGEGNTQIGKAIASKVDIDAITVLQAGTNKKTSAGVIGYTGIVEALDLFTEEVATDKVMFVAPQQRTQLRLDPEFKNKDTYGGDVMMTGEIGMIAGVRIVVSKRIVAKTSKYACPIVKLNPAEMTDDETAALTIYLKRDTNVETERDMETRSTRVGADKHYVAALTDNSKVVVAEFAVTAPVTP